MDTTIAHIRKNERHTQLRRLEQLAALERHYARAFEPGDAPEVLLSATPWLLTTLRSVLGELDEARGVRDTLHTELTRLCTTVEAAYGAPTEAP